MSALERFTSFDPRPGFARFTAARALLARMSTVRSRLAWSGAGEARTGALRRLVRGRRRGLVLRSGLMALAAALLAAGGLAAASGLLASPPASGQALAVPAPRWAEIRRPLALYDLAGTEFSKLPASYRARRREADGAREDVMTFGRLSDAKPFLQVSLLRSGPASPSVADGGADGLADGLARLAGTRGLTATRVRPAAPMDTRLGRFEAADLLLWDGGASTPCLGFRGGGGALRVAGFACGVPGRPMGRAALACAIDRIDLVSAGDDAALRAVFVAAERRGGAEGNGTCLGGPSLVAAGAGGRNLGWLDPGGVLPPLRGLFEATVRRR